MTVNRLEFSTASDASSHEQEPSLAIADDGRVVVSSNAAGAGTYRIGYRLSLDEGKTFAPIGWIPLPANNNVCSNATVAAAGNDV